MRKGFVVLGLSLAGVVATTTLVKYVVPHGTQASRAGASRSGAGQQTEAATALEVEGGRDASSPSSWQVGARHRYAVQARMSFGQAQNEGGPAAGASWSATLQATVLEVSAQKVSIGYTLHDVRFTATTPDGSVRSVPQIERDLALPFAASYDSRGHLSAVHLAPTITPDSQPLLRGLLAQMQFSVPSGDVQSWTAQESDSAGEYLASYARLKGPGNYRKQKLKYLPVSRGKGSTAQGANEQKVLRSQAIFAMGSDGRLARLRFQELAGVNIQGSESEGDTQFRAQVELSVELLEQSQVPLAALDNPLPGLLTSDVILAAKAGAEASAQGDRDLVAGGTLSSLLDELAQLPKTAHKDRATIQARLSALLRLEPARIGETLGRIRGKDPEAQMLIAALAGANTTETQAALVDLALDGSLEKESRAQVLANITALDQPNKDTLTRLRPLMADADPEVRAQAALAVGAATRALGSTDPQAAQTATSDLVKLVNQSGSEEEKLWAIRSLGNAGSEGALPTLTGVLGGDSVAMREAAAQALRFVPGTEADQVLARVMTTDSSEQVRSAAVFAARFRESEAVVGSVERAARNDASETVRQQAVQTLGRVARDSNAPLETLDYVANNDTSEQNREAAKRILSNLVPSSDEP
jgi:HEAT repeat protein